MKTTQYMRWLAMAGLVAAGLGLCGCTTNPIMKGSPFYSGEFKQPRQAGPAEDRVPLWPAVYYREPVLSIGWLLVERVRGESFAIRPLYSEYDPDDPTNHEWNVLWPLVHEEPGNSRGRAVPFFWGPDYSIGFPLWWHYDRAGGASDLMIPLWWYDHDALSSHFITLLGGGWSSKKGGGWVVPPLLSGGSHDADGSDLWVVWPLSHFGEHNGNSSSYIVPAYYWDSKSDTLFTIPYASWKRGDGARTRLSIPLLAMDTVKDDEHDLFYLAGLARYASASNMASWLIPFYYDNPKTGTTLSPVYCTMRDKDGSTTVIPPLLGAMSADKLGHKELWAAAGLYGHEWDGQGAISDYLVPLYAYSASNYFYTAIMGWQGGKMDGWSYYCTPLVGSSHKDEVNKSWVFPLYHRTADARSRDVRGHFIWGTFHSTPKESHSQFFPFWNHDYSEAPNGDVEDNTTAALWLYGDKSEKTRTETNESSWVFPFWSHDVKQVAGGDSVEKSAALLALYDTKHETVPLATAPNGVQDYTRKRLLWHLWHYEKTNGDVSVDIFPGIAWDSKPDGFHQLAWLWRLVRWQRDGEGKRKFDLLFLPLIRDT